jgi:hypothetical protein
LRLGFFIYCRSSVSGTQFASDQYKAVFAMGLGVVVPTGIGCEDQGVLYVFVHALTVAWPVPESKGTLTLSVRFGLELFGRQCDRPG